MIPYKKATLTADQKYAMEVARVGFMAACPFFAHYFYAEMEEYPTLDMPTAATDGRRIFYNPEYLAGLKPSERVFVLAHEVDHVICRHPQRFRHYRSEGNIKGKPADQQQANHAMDYVINAGLLETGVGTMNPSWLYDQQVTGEDLWEDVYVRKFKDDKGKGGSSQGQSQGSTYGGSGKAPKGAQGDARADAAGGGFDDVLPPAVDPVTGREDVPDEAEFKEAIARAASAAKAMGNMPAAFQRIVDDILTPQVDWREHIRMLMTGKIGNRHETWTKPNRRRLALNPIVVLPGRRGYGAELVVVGVDTSGSIGPQELATFIAEVGGILQDVKPRRILVVGCDAAVSDVREVTTLDELADVRRKGLKGGGGTRFQPVFEYVEREGLRPDTLVYLTDMMGSFPHKTPPYPVIWAATTDTKGPFGDTVRIEG